MLNVYEVVNRTRRESLIALSPDDPPALRGKLGPPRPKPIAHWDHADELVVELVASRMPLGDAEAFLVRFLARTRAPDWATIVWRF